jgi:hypothetical protein
MLSGTGFPADKEPTEINFFLEYNGRIKIALCPIILTVYLLNQIFQGINP